MARFGGYITTSELHPTSTGCVYAARRADEPDSTWPRYVVKTFVPDRRVLGDAEAESRLSRFLAAAAYQREAASTWFEPVGGLAAVHELGRFDADGVQGAFVVMDRARRGSSRRLTAGARRVDPAGLANIVRQVGVTLAGLKVNSAARPHGNLRPDNILMLDDAAPATVRVVLSDPASPSTAEAMGPRGAGRDLRAIGELIYVLVMRREYNGSWPVADAPAWQALGPTGAAWLELCNALLDRAVENAATPPITIQQVLERIPVPRPARPRWVLPAAIAALLAMAAAAAVFLTGQRGATIEDFSQVKQAGDEQVRTMLAEWSQLVAAHRSREGWIDVLYRLSGDRKAPVDAKVDVGEQALRSRLQQSAPEVLTRAAELIKPELRPSSIRADWPRNEDLPELQVLAPDRDVEADVRAIRDLSAERRLEFKNWWFVSNYALERSTPAITAVRSMRDWLTSEDQWGAQKQVDGLLESIGAADAPLVAAMKARREALTKALQDANQDAAAQIAEFAEVGRAAQHLSAAVAGVRAEAERGGDAGLRTISQRWTELWGNGSGNEVRSADLEQLASLLDRVAKVPRTTPDTEQDVAATLLAQGLEPLGGVLRLASADVEDWLAVRMGSHPGVAARTRLREIDQSIQSLLKAGCGMGSPPSEVASARAGVARDVELLVSKRATAGGAEALRSPAESLRAATDALGADVQARIARAEADARRLADSLERELRDFAAPEAVRSQAAVAVLRTRMTALADRRGLGACEKALERDEWVRLFSKFISDASGGSASVVGEEGWVRGLAEHAARDEERAIATVLEGVRWSERAADHATVLAEAATSVKSSLAETRAQMADLVAALRMFDERLVRDFRLGEPAGDTAAAAWQSASRNRRFGEEGVRGAVTPLATRREQHIRISQSRDAAELERVMTSGENALDVRIAAWSRLTADDGPVWPLDGDGLAAAPRLAEQVLSGSGGAAAKERVAEGGRRAWLRFVTRQAEPAADRDARAAQLSRAIELGDQFGVSRAQWPPRVRLASELALLSKALAAVDTEAENVDAQVDALWNPLKGRVASLGLDSADAGAWAALERVVDQEIADTRGGIKFEKLGPGTLGFPVRAIDRGAKLEFTIAGNPVMFHQLKVGEIYWYLAETEVSIKLFSDLLANRRAFARAVDEGWIIADDQVLGARGWIVRGTSLAAAPAWLVSKPGYTTEPAFVGGRGLKLPDGFGREPATDMPMHRLSNGGAQAWAALAGCELPTVAAWKGALAMNAAALGGQRPAERSINLRDQVFERERAHVDRVRAAGSKTFDIDDFYSPDWDAYAPEGPAAGGDDGTLFFRAVADDPSAVPFKNLLGNVAELVLDERAQFAVIGGSALSSAGRTDDAVVIEGEYYTDVGMRLAFSSATAIKPPMNEAVAAVMKQQLGPVPILLR